MESANASASEKVREAGYRSYEAAYDSGSDKPNARPCPEEIGAAPIGEISEESANKESDRQRNHHRMNRMAPDGRSARGAGIFVLVHPIFFAAAKNEHGSALSGSTDQPGVFGAGWRARTLERSSVWPGSALAPHGLARFAISWRASISSGQRFLR